MKNRAIALREWGILQLQGLGRFGIVFADMWRWSFRRPFRVKLLLQQIESMGIASLPIVCLVGLFSGMVFALQSGYSFSSFNAETLVGATVGISLTREIGPVFTSLMLVARCGSAIAAEIGTMAVSEQIDALEVMAVNPVQYLIVPRVWAAVIIAPLLTGLFSIVGVMGAYLVGIYLLAIPEGPFMDRLYNAVDPSDLWGGLFKSLFFAVIMVSICAYQGMMTRGGAVGVGRATTKAVVFSSVAVLVSDYFLTAWVLEFIQN